MNRIDPRSEPYEAAFQSHDGRNDAPLYGGRGYPIEEDPAFRDDPRYAWAYPEASAYGHQQGFMERAGHRFAEVEQQIEGAVSGLLGRRLPKGYKRSDERIREDVAECLSDHPELDPTDIEISVQDGEVTLSGTVTDRPSKKLAEALLQSVRGIDEVHNRLEIRRSPPSGV